MAYVNLWALITTVASLDRPDSEKCRAIKVLNGPGFGTELSLEIVDNGTWTIEVFDHEDSDSKVTLAIQPNGNLTVTRCRTIHDVCETRTVSF